MWANRRAESRRRVRLGLSIGAMDCWLVLQDKLEEIELGSFFLWQSPCWVYKEREGSKVKGMVSGGVDSKWEIGGDP